MGTGRYQKTHRYSVKGEEIMSKKIYFVTFEIHKNCTVYNYIYHCEASTAKEAKEIARVEWSGRKGYQFHLYGKKSNIQNADLLRVKSVFGREYSGSEVIGMYIPLDLRTWRVDGRNLYGV